MAWIWLLQNFKMKSSEDAAAMLLKLVEKKKIFSFLLDLMLSLTKYECKF